MPPTKTFNTFFSWIDPETEKKLISNFQAIFLFCINYPVINYRLIELNGNGNENGNHSASVLQKSIKNSMIMSCRMFSKKSVFFLFCLFQNYMLLDFSVSWFLAIDQIEFQMTRFRCETIFDWEEKK